MREQSGGEESGARGSQAARDGAPFGVLLGLGTVELGFKGWKPINWQSGIVFWKRGFLSIYPSILGTEFGSGVWPGRESF